MLTSPARLSRPCRLAGPAHPAATAGFSIPQGEIPRETDCLLEGDGFELPVPRAIGVWFRDFALAADLICLESGGTAPGDRPRRGVCCLTRAERNEVRQEPMVR